MAELCRRRVPTVLAVIHDVGEAITLADRVVVLTDGGFSLDVRVDLERIRRRDAAESVEQRSQLLFELGVNVRSRTPASRVRARA